MFANFLYFIIALLILALYQPQDPPGLALPYAALLFCGIIFIFATYTRNVFRRLVRQVRWTSRGFLDQAYSRQVTRSSILALVLFAAEVWALDLPAFVKLIPPFKALPTLSDLIFLMIFTGHLALIWYFAFSAQQAIHETQISRRSYVYSNIAFSIPILIPYTLLSGILDILLLVPFELPKRILNTTMGQIGYFTFFLIIAALFAPIVVQALWRCRPLEDGPIRQRIEALCERSGVACADVVYWPIFDGRMITAGVMGLVGRFRYILVTEALLQLLHPEEIEQVIAHEIGHVKRNHLALYLLFFIGFMLVSYTLSITGYYLIFLNTASLKFLLQWEIDLTGAFQIFSAAGLILAVVVYFRFLFGYFMRNFERQADGYVFRLFPNARPLINTFAKIVTTSGQSANKPNWHHFSIGQRMDFLKQCETSPILIAQHDRKMRNSIAVYLTGLALVALAVFQFNQFIDQQANAGFTVDTLAAYLDHKQTETETDALLYLMLGNLYYERNQWVATAAAYEKGLYLDPDQADILNNLAWLLSTAPHSTVQDHQRALSLAQRSVELKKAPHTLDTLAECFFVNGRIKEAIATEQAALAMDPKERRIYEDQLARFTQALSDQ